MRSDAANVLVRCHLDASIRELEKEAAGARFNTFCIRALAAASSVLGLPDIAERALSLLRAAPDGAFFAGMITNFELPKTVPDRLRNVGAPGELESQHPVYCEEAMVGRIRANARTEGHFALCLEGKAQEAQSNSAGLTLEEVGATLAVLGDLDSALRVARDPRLEPFRQRGVLLVLVIETFRRGQVDTCEALLTELESSGAGAWDRVSLALGFAGREPWRGYPYPDW